MRAVEVVIELLKAAEQLPPGYGAAAHNQLPRPPPLLGREDTLAHVLATLRRERQVTIGGGPGEGKSALAAEAAHRMSNHKLLPGGVFAIDLAAVLSFGELQRMPCCRIYAAQMSGHAPCASAAVCATGHCH